MRHEELRKAINEIRDVLLAAGRQDVGQSLTDLFDRLDDGQDASPDEMVKRLRAAVDQMGIPAPARYSARLAEIGLEEAAFASLLDEIANDPSLKKADMQAILRAYTGRHDKRSSLAQLKEDLKRAFYTKLYDRDAQEMANRATPV